METETPPIPEEIKILCAQGEAAVYAVMRKPEAIIEALEAAVQ